MAEAPDAGAGDHLPLRPLEFQILVQLAAGEKHGWAILQDAEVTGPAVPGIATLYRTLQRLESNRLIERRRDLETDDERRRVYGITPLGRTLAAAEARRLHALLGVARAADLLEERDAR
jgi:DNA-binding PadR family transcriptional regulator